MFLNTSEKQLTAKAIREKSGGDILVAFNGEYPALYEDLVTEFKHQGFKVNGEQLTVSAWIIQAKL
jgi:hypothetical protein